MKLKFLKKNENGRIVFVNSIGSFIVKGLSLFVSLFTTPAFMRYFDNDIVLGVWYTLLSILTWFLTFDLGVANGIRNNLTKAITQEDYESAKKVISSGIVANFLITLVLTIIGVTLINIIDLPKLFNVSTDIIPKDVLFKSTMIIFAGIMIKLLLTTVNALFYSIQKSFINSMLHLCITVLQLLFVSIFKFNSPSEALLAISYAYVFSASVPYIIAGIIIFLTKLRNCVPSIKYVEKEYINKVMGIGVVFFICQILYMIISNTNDFFITNLYGPEFTTEYQIYYRLTNIIAMLFSIALSPIWSIVTKAQTEKNFVWMNKMYKIMKFLGVLVIVFQFAIIPILQFIVNIWLGDEAIEINTITAIAFAVYGSLFIYTSILSTMACGLGKMKYQTIAYSVAVALKLLLIFILKDYISNWTMIIWVSALVLLPYCVGEQISVNKYIKKNIKNSDLSQEGV